VCAQTKAAHKKDGVTGSHLHEFDANDPESDISVDEWDRVVQASLRTVEEIRQRYVRYNEVMGEGVLNTPEALASNWSRLAEDKPRNEVASTFRAIWPNGKFDEAGWKEILRGFYPSEITKALEHLGYSHEYPPGAVTVKKYLIHERLGDEAPLDPEEALQVAQTYRESVLSSYGDGGIELDAMVHDAYALTQQRAGVFDSKVFLSIYRDLLADFYSEWLPQST